MDRSIGNARYAQYLQTFEIGERDDDFAEVSISILNCELQFDLFDLYISSSPGLLSGTTLMIPRYLS